MLIQIPKNNCYGGNSSLQRLILKRQVARRLVRLPGPQSWENQRNIRGLTINGIGCNHL